METIFFSVFIFYFILTLAENYMATNWQPNYFRYGIPIYYKQISLITGQPDLAQYNQQLEGNLSKNSGNARINFKPLSAHELAFHVKYKKRSGSKGQDSYGHGILKFDPIQQKLSFKGYLTLSNLIFILLFGILFARIPFTSSIGILFFPAIVLLITTFSSIKRFKDYGRINSAIQQTFQDQMAFFEQLPSDIYSKNPEFKTPDIQTYDPFTTTKSNSTDTMRIILIVILVGFLILIAGVSALFWLTYAG